MGDRLTIPLDELFRMLSETSPGPNDAPASISRVRWTLQSLADTVRNELMETREALGKKGEALEEVEQKTIGWANECGRCRVTASWALSVLRQVVIRIQNSSRLKTTREAQQLLLFIDLHMNRCRAQAPVVVLLDVTEEEFDPEKGFPEKNQSERGDHLWRFTGY